MHSCSKPPLIGGGGFNTIFGSYLRYAQGGRGEQRSVSYIGVYSMTRERIAEGEREKTGKIAWTKIAWHKDVSFATLLSARYRHLSPSPVQPTRYFRLR